MKNRIRRSWIWAALALAAVVCWIIVSAATAPKAGAQLGAPPYSYQRFGGPLFFSLGNRPLTIFGGGQFGFGYFNPMQPGSFGTPAQGPQDYYLVAVDPNTYYNYSGPTANVPPGAEAGAQQIASYPQAVGVYPIARTNDTFDVDYDKEGKLRIQWIGETMAARLVTFSLLNSQRMVLKEVTIDRLPAEARFDRNEKAAYAQAIVLYVNGTTNAVVFPLQPPASKEQPKAATPEPAAPKNGAKPTPKEPG